MESTFGRALIASTEAIMSFSQTDCASFKPAFLHIATSSSCSLKASRLAATTVTPDSKPGRYTTPRPQNDEPDATTSQTKVKSSISMRSCYLERQCPRRISSVRCAQCHIQQNPKTQTEHKLTKDVRNLRRGASFSKCGAVLPLSSMVAK